MAKEKYCDSCGYVGKSKFKVKGSPVVEIFLWLCFIVPGVIYSLWRSTSGYRVCRMCGGVLLLPLDSPKAMNRTA